MLQVSCRQRPQCAAERTGSAKRTETDFHRHAPAPDQARQASAASATPARLDPAHLLSEAPARRYTDAEHPIGAGGAGKCSVAPSSWLEFRNESSNVRKIVLVCLPVHAQQ